MLYYKNNNNLAGQNMLTQKALNKKLTATLCTTTNTIFVHYSSDINQDEPIASSHVVELSLSFIDRVKQFCI